MPPKKTSPADWLSLIAERAKALRDAGVTYLELEGCTVQLAPKDEPREGAGQPEVESMDPLSDAATFGMFNGGRVPSIRRRDEDDE